MAARREQRGPSHECLSKGIHGCNVSHEFESVVLFPSF